MFRTYLQRNRPPAEPLESVLIHGMNYAPELIGIGKYTTELAEFLAGRGKAVDVVTAHPHYPAWSVATGWPWRWSGRRNAGVHITHCPLLARPGRFWRMMAPLSFALSAAPAVIWRALRTRPQTILCVEPTLLAAPAALLAARLVGARTVLHVQDLEFDAAFATGYLCAAAPLKGLARAYQRAVRRRFDAVVTISDAMAARLRHQGAPASLAVLRNWVAPRPAVPREASDAVRCALGVPAGARLVLYAGNLGAKQGLPVLIEAARHLRADPSVRFVVVGDGIMAGRLRAVAAGLPNVSIHGLLPAEQLGAMLAAADLHLLLQERAAANLVFPSKLGPLLQSGRPILSTAEPDSELATWLGPAAARCTPGDGKALAQAVVALLAHPPTPDAARCQALLAALDAETILPAFEHCLLAPKPASPTARATRGFRWRRSHPLPAALA